MRLVWLSWKDLKHPLAGGAEVVTHNLLKRLAADGHEVVLVTSRPPNTQAEETVDGYKIVRAGNRYSVYFKARKYYEHTLKNWADIVIDETNTIPFYASKYSSKPTLLFVHQLARKVWFYQMTWPLNWIGYMLEPLYLRPLNNEHVITISESTKQDLIKTAGFKAQNIKIITQGSGLEPLTSLNGITKYEQPTLLSLGSVRPMKGTANIVAAFEHAKKQLPDLRLLVAGDMSGPYGEKVAKQIKNSPYKADIQILGRVSQGKKEELMQRSHAIAVASVKEGWGLIVTEANGQGTPAVGYDVDGLRDSIKHQRTGLVAHPDPQSLGDAVVALLKDPQYETIRRNSWQDSKQYTFDNCYKDFIRLATDYLNR